MAFTNSTDSNSVTVISVTGEETFGEDENEDFTTIVVTPAVPGSKSVITITYTNSNFQFTSAGRGFTISGFNTDDLNTNNATILRIQNDNRSGVWNGIANTVSIFANTLQAGTGNNSVVNTVGAYVDRIVSVINDPVGADFFGGGGTLNDDFYQFTASKATTSTTTSLILTSKDDGAWSDITTTYNANGTGTPQAGVSGTPGVTTAGDPGTPAVTSPRPGVTYRQEGGRHIYTLSNTTRLQIGNTVANADGTTSTITANGILNHNTEKSVLIFERTLSLASSQTQNYAVITAQAASVNQSIDPSVYNFGIQTSSTSGPKVVTTTAQSIRVGDIVLVPQNGGQSDNKRFQNKVADTSVTLSTTFTNTTNWTALSDSPVVFSDGLGIYFANPRTGGDGSPDFNWWYGGGQNGVYGGTSGHFMVLQLII